jgi:hypothetical protein
MAASSSSSTTSQVPKVVKFGYDDFRNADGKRSAKCKFCVHAKVVITERTGTTSNFVRHLERVHSQRYILGNLLLL